MRRLDGLLLSAAKNRLSQIRVQGENRVKLDSSLDDIRFVVLGVGFGLRIGSGLVWIWVGFGMGIGRMSCAKRFGSFGVFLDWSRSPGCWSLRRVSGLVLAFVRVLSRLFLWVVHSAEDWFGGLVWKFWPYLR